MWVLRLVVMSISELGSVNHLVSIFLYFLNFLFVAFFESLCQHLTRTKNVS